MRSYKFGTSILLTLVLLLIFSSFSVAYAAKPVPSLNLVTGDTTNNSLTVIVSWENVPAYGISIEIKEFSSVGSFIESRYIYTESFVKRTNLASNITYYASWATDAASGNNLIATVKLYDKKGNVIMEDDANSRLIP